MQCDKARCLFNPSLEGELDGPLAAQMEAHLASCAACRSEMEGLRHSISLMETLPSLIPPPGLASRVMACVLQRDEADNSVTGSPLGWIVAAVLSGIGALLLYGYLGDGGLPWDPSILDSVNPIGLDNLASLLVSLEVGVVVGATLLFAGMTGLLVQLLGREQQCQHG